MFTLNTNKMALKLAVATLKQLIATPSISGHEYKASAVIQNVLESQGYVVNRKMNNVWAYCKDYDSSKPTILLNSHIDTVKPTGNWLSNPYKPFFCEGKLTGLGSNDAGASLVSLLAVFLLAEKEKLKFNRVFVASAEEEISGENGIKLVLPELGNIDVGIIGEPTQMELAIAEKGLMVLDCLVSGKSGHAAHTDGINAIRLAMDEIDKLLNTKFKKRSKVLGDVKLSVTQINAGSQHNVIPDKCTFVLDVRVNEFYSNQEIWDCLKSKSKAAIKPRSLRLNSSSISDEHLLVKAAECLNIPCFGSSTTSDQAVISDFPTVKIGPGDSNRSHTANEYILLDEIESGIEKYMLLLKKYSELCNG